MGLLKKKDQKINIEQTKEIIKRLGLLCLYYKGNMDIFDKELNNLELQYNKEYYCIINYFRINKRKFFEKGDYNYNYYTT